MKSECIYEIINFPKCHRKNLIDFCPGFYRLVHVICFDYKQGDSTKVGGWVHNIPSLNKPAGQKSIKFFGWYIGKSMIS